ncbi:MAG: toxin-antitoxin system YwqK family antitoxin [Parachlamydiales bacterium]|jgi:antitoxin component YwqK of YwqJK toxin-antitoxin module
MKSLKRLVLLGMAFTFFSCQKDNESNVVAEKFVHKYGFDMTKDEWQSRKDGTSIAQLTNGVTVTNSFANGILHGATTYTYPNSSIMEKVYIYENGTLTKEILHDINGIPFKESVNEPNNKKIITLWDNFGVPISVEQYENDLLVDGKYYKPNNELEASIENNSGFRTKRDRNGELQYKDQVENGKLLTRTTFHSNGQIKSTMSFQDYKLHGDQINYSPDGQILMTMTWKKGNLDGMHTIYKNGNKIAEIPYFNGLKHGIERHYSDNGKLSSETHWDQDKKHGSERIYTDNDTEIKWFFKGKTVSSKKFEEFSLREQLIANKDQFLEMINTMDEKIALEE